MFLESTYKTLKGPAVTRKKQETYRNLRWFALSPAVAFTLMAISRGIGIENKIWAGFLLLWFIPIPLIGGLLYDIVIKIPYRKNGTITFTNNELTIKYKNRTTHSIQSSNIKSLKIEKGMIRGYDLKPFVRPRKNTLYDKIPFKNWTGLSIEITQNNHERLTIILSNETDWNSRNNYDSHFEMIIAFAESNNIEYQLQKTYK